MIKQNQRMLNVILVACDGLCVVISLFLAWWLRFYSGVFAVEGAFLSLAKYMSPLGFIIPIYLLIYNLFKLYEAYRTKNIIDEILNITKSNFIGFFIFISILFVVNESDYSRFVIFLFTIICIGVTAVERMILRAILRKARKSGHNVKYIILIGYSQLVEEFIDRVHNNRQWGYKILGIIDDKFQKDEKIREYPVLGDFDYLGDFLSLTAVDEVFITLDISEYKKLKKIIRTCEKNGVRTQIIPDYYKYIPAKPYVEELEGLPVINIRYIPLDNLINRLLKRTFDIVVSLVAIIVVSPLLLLVAIIIKVTSPGEIIFKQERVGHNKRNFMMYKFRSMHVQKDEDSAILWTTPDDPRKTKFGAFMRKTSIDELPQLFNVLKGDMSLVGPRPERPHFVDKFKEEVPKYMIKHQVRPGITGWAQVNGWRGDTSIEKRIEHDIYYIENWHIGLDIQIMFMTIFKGIINKNAY